MSRAWALAGLVSLAALYVAGCSCNAPNTFDQRYCEAYSETTLGPAVAIGVAFFALTFVVWVAVRRRGQVAPRDQVVDATPAPPDPGEGDASATLEALLAKGTPSGGILEGFDGRWMVALTFGEGRDAVGFLTGWSTREGACREALDEIERREHDTSG